MTPEKATLLVDTGETKRHMRKNHTESQKVEEDGETETLKTTRDLHNKRN